MSTERTVSLDEAQGILITARREAEVARARMERATTGRSMAAAASEHRRWLLLTDLAATVIRLRRSE